jgi:hypothetical protein
MPRHGLDSERSAERANATTRNECRSQPCEMRMGEIDLQIPTLPSAVTDILSLCALFSIAGP